jgi:hypothetical protein
MEKQVRRLNAEYGFDLSEEEITIVARQAEEAQCLCESLSEVDLTHVMPILKVDSKRVAK